MINNEVVEQLAHAMFSLWLLQPFWITNKLQEVLADVQEQSKVRYFSCMLNIVHSCASMRDDATP